MQLQNQRTRIESAPALQVDLTKLPTRPPNSPHMAARRALLSCAYAVHPHAAYHIGVTPCQATCMHSADSFQRTISGRYLRLWRIVWSLILSTIADFGNAPGQKLDLPGKKIFPASEKRTSQAQAQGILHGNNTQWPGHCIPMYCSPVSSSTLSAACFGSCARQVTCI